MENRSIAYEKSFKLAIRIINMCKHLQKEKKNILFLIRFSNQLQV